VKYVLQTIYILIEYLQTKYFALNFSSLTKRSGFMLKQRALKVLPNHIASHRVANYGRQRHFLVLWY
jgi:hypothetical protein